jgi:hypothetical protein
MAFFLVTLLFAAATSAAVGYLGTAKEGATAKPVKTSPETAKAAIRAREIRRFILSKLT